MTWSGMIWLSGSALRSVAAPWLLAVLGLAGLLQACSSGTAFKAGANSGGTSEGGVAPNAGQSSGGSSSGQAGAASGGTAGMGGSSNLAGDAGAGGGAVTLPCDGACTGDQPVCKAATDKCVECLKPADCAVGTKTKCDTATNTCLECLASKDCATASAGRCDAGVCVECETNDDCTHLSGKGVCDEGECVQCTVSDESGCAGKSCDPATNACTGTTAGSVGPCEPCVTDSECIGGNRADPDSRCVPMEFNGVPRTGGFCLRREAKTCTKPFATLIAAVSTSGAASETYCGIDQESVRCEAVLDLASSAACADGQDTSCGCARDQDGKCTETGVGGLCRKVGAFTNRCTFSCATPDQCPGGTTCTLADPYCH